jgi:serine phosphatase RsbU (regulator of sigma subunit)/anti-sigma regulatory factor (Ser/Thr protein kinase)/anti-anti-sigma regulatory factor
VVDTFDGEPAGPAGAAADVYETFEQLPMGLAGFRGPDLAVAANNASFRRLVAQDLLGTPLRRVPLHLEGTNLYEQFERVYRTGEPMTGSEWRVQYDTGDGNGLQEFFFTFGIFPHRSADGRIVGVDHVLTEVTEQVRARRATQARAAEAERRLSAAQNVITAIQRQFLPTGLPVLPRVRVGASYLLAEADTAAGGDWFDAVPLPGGRVGLVLGDVVGHGVTASATMGRLRAVLEDRLDETGEVGPAMAAADRLARRLSSAHAATVCVAVLDPTTGDLVYCTAGHPPPLRVPADGPPEYLAPTGAGPLGTGGGYPTRTAHLDPGDLLLLYSDGILERPGREVVESTVELAQVAGNVAAHRVFRLDEATTVDRMCTQVLELMLRPTGHADDVTLLAVQRVPEPEPLRLVAPAELAAIADVRDELDGWLAQVGAGGEDVVRLRHAVGELVTNAVEHGYADGAEGKDLRVFADLDRTGRVEVRVVDHGAWREVVTDPRRGRGLAMAADLVDELDVVRGAAGGGGTTAVVRRRLTRPARLLTTAELLPSRAGDRDHAPELLLVLEQPQAPEPRIRVDGPVDARTAPQLAVQLRHHTRGGTRGLTVDLTGVTHLASAGVSVLHEATGRSREHESPLRLYAPPDSTAHYVMSVVALDHETGEPDGGSG